MGCCCSPVREKTCVNFCRSIPVVEDAAAVEDEAVVVVVVAGTVPIASAVAAVLG